jgi:hypothetical protein
LTFASKASSRESSAFGSTPTRCPDLASRDLGVVVGAGVGWKFPFGTVEVQARYTRGLVDTRDDHGGKTINRTLFLMAGFGIALDRQHQ